MAKRVRIVIENFKEMYKEDMKSGNGFLITDAEGIIDKERTENGIFSPKYGSTFGDDNAFEEKYRCDCGSLMGVIHEGVECSNCNTIVKFKDNNLWITGWLKLDEYRLIHPILFGMLKNFIGTNVLDNIIKIHGKTNTKGVFERQELKMNKPYDKFLGIGMIEFENRFDEIMEFFLKFSKRQNKEKEYEFIMEHKGDIFIKHVPVFSLLLRPISISDETLKFGKINTKYAVLCKKIHRLNRKELSTDQKDIKILRNLYVTQTQLLNVYDSVIASLSKKEGQFRGTLAARFNYSSRNVIVPLSGYKTNEVILPYLGFLEIYRAEIINVMMKMENITINEAHDKWVDATIKFNKKIYEIMKYLIKNTKGGLRILINRNPSINYGSILAMRVADVKRDYHDYTMAVPINVLAVLGGDFDGDVLTIVTLKGKKFVNVYNRLYNPRTNMFISRNDGLFNPDFNLVKDQLISLHKFCELSRADVRKVRMKRK